MVKDGMTVLGKKKKKVSPAAIGGSPSASESLF